VMFGFQSIGDSVDRVGVRMSHFKIDPCWHRSSICGGSGSRLVEKIVGC